MQRQRLIKDMEDQHAYQDIISHFGFAGRASSIPTRQQIETIPASEAKEVIAGVNLGRSTCEKSALF